MMLSGATIDCWLFTSGHNAGGLNDDSYFDYQHHNWIITPIAIDNTEINTPAYTWTIDGNGHDDDGSWATSHATVVSTAQIFINSDGQVILQQSEGYGAHEVPAEGNSHQISELIWPALTWDPNLATPTTIAFSDGRPPTSRIWFVRINGKLIKKTVGVPGLGGEDWTHKTQYFQKPAAVRATAWWSYTITLT